MQAQLFYKTTAEKTILLQLMTAATFQSLALSSSVIQNTLAAQQFTAKMGDVGFIYDAQGFLERVYIGYETGKTALAVARCLSRLPEGDYQFEQDVPTTVELCWALAQYRFAVYKKKPSVTRCLLVAASKIAALVREADAVFLVRDLINQPANVMHPSGMANVVEALAKQHGAEFKQWVGDDLLTHQFPAIHAVGRAAAEAPRLLSLTWGQKHHPKVTLVGKGVCFDSGGLDIKDSANMRLMKKDMGGAAQVIGLAQWLMQHELPIRLQVLIPAVENAIDGNAYRPGDILTMRNQLTVEIDNTDAEGRLVLADALVKACEDKPELLIDFATLTGAARVAVGTEISAMFTPSNTLAEALTRFGEVHEDPIWRMPLYANYLSLLDSSVADLTNSAGTAYAGAIVAALFLQKFVDHAVEWVHFDLMAWNLRQNNPARPEGGEAMAIRAVGHYLIERYGSSKMS